MLIRSIIMFKSNFTGTRRSIARLIIATICIVIAVFQVIEGMKMINNNKEMPDITVHDFDMLKYDQVVQGELKELFATMYLDKENGEEPLDLYFAFTDSGHIMTFRAMPGSEMDSKLSDLFSGKTESVMYKGKVKKMTAAYHAAIRQNLGYGKLSKKYKFEGSAKEVLLDYMIDASPYDSGYSQKAIIATFVGAGLMVLLAFLVLFKLIKNAIISIAAEKGHFKPELKVTKDDITFEMEGNYQGNEEYGEDFFVSTEYNIRDYGVNKNDSTADKRQLPS